MKRPKKLKKNRAPRKRSGAHISSVEMKLVKTAAWLTHLKTDEGRKSISLGEMQDYYRAA